MWVSQHEELLKLISDISANVDQINDRVNTLEKNVRVMNIRMKNNKDVLYQVQDDLHKVKKSVTLMQKQQSGGGSNISNNYEQRLKLLETKLTSREANTGTRTHVHPANGTIDEDENTCYIKNLPYGQRDLEDVNTLLTEGMGIDVRVQSVTRAPSVHNMAGVLAIKLHSREDAQLVMRNKRKLRYTEKYHNVYIDREKSSAQVRMEHKFRMLLNNVQYDRSREFRGPAGPRAHPGHFPNRGRSRFQ